MKYLIYIVLALLIVAAATRFGDIEHTKAYWTGFIAAVFFDLAWNVATLFDKE